MAYAFDPMNYRPRLISAACMLGHLGLGWMLTPALADWNASTINMACAVGGCVVMAPFVPWAAPLASGVVTWDWIALLEARARAAGFGVEPQYTTMPLFAGRLAVVTLLIMALVALRLGGRDRFRGDPAR